MIIGVPKEIKDNEFRVGLVPSGARILTNAGHKVLVEKGSGEGSGIVDEAYAKAGATLIERAEDVFDRSEMIVKVKEPLPREYPLIKEGQIIFTFLHLAPLPDLIQALVNSRSVGVAYETIQLEDGSLPLLTPMSEVAGRVAPQMGAYYLRKASGGRGILLGGVPGVERARVTIIGGGVVGLAIAAELATHRSDCSVVLLERHARFGQETSSRNSEVIHAGIYYPRESLKARLCVEGNRRMYDFCAQWQVPCTRLGKLIVANTDEELKSLQGLLAAGAANGVSDLQLLDRAQARRLEPRVQALAALYSPSTGIVDSHCLMARLELLAREGHAVLAYNHEVVGIERSGDMYVIRYQAPAGECGSIASQWVVNSAGLAADTIASLAGIDKDAAGYRLFPCKGEYFRLPPAKSRQLSHLVYPPPYKDLRGLGIHVTLARDGTARLGPNAFYVDQLDYGVDPAHAAEFYAGVRDFLPFVAPGDLVPDTAGIRPKLQAPGTPLRDFVVCHEQGRGLPGFINLIGIESPGLTASLSLAAMVKNLITAEA